MPNKINLMCVGGPYGDCTSAYEFTMPKQMTLKEFAEMVAADGKEWGAIRKGSPFGDVLAEYNRSGEIKYRDYADPNAILELKGTAHGGWSLMDYHVNIDKNAELGKLQEQYNKFLEENQPEPVGGLMGWICPKCGAVMSPYQNCCVKCTRIGEITYDTGTPIYGSEKTGYEYITTLYKNECNGGNE